MSRAILLILTVLLVTAGPSIPAQQQAAPTDDIAGVYRCEGVNGDGEPYTGVVIIARNHDAYQLQWSFSGNADAIGLGIRSGDTLSVSYFGDRPGVVSYTISGNRLSGRWTVVGGAGVLADETLTLLRAHAPGATPRREPRGQRGPREQPDEREQRDQQEQREERAPETPRIRV